MSCNNCNCHQPKFEVAHIGQKEEDAIKKAENLIKQETGKDFVMIAWEKKLH